MPHCYHNGIRKGFFSKKISKELTNKVMCDCMNVVRQCNSQAVRILLLNHFPEKNLQRGSGEVLLSHICTYS